MTKVFNISAHIKKQLPAGLVDFMRLAGEVGKSRGQRLYLVGGVVRDLLMGWRPGFDLDLVVEGDAISLAQELAQVKSGKVISHRAFNTATIKWDGWRIDLATARSETYAQPGALPRVKPDTINEDLFRRDFTINSMAVRLEPARYGELIDLHGGRDDIERRFIRILHEKSFVDDATRIWRAIRYEQRLDFTIELETLKMLKRGVSYLDTISGDRIRHELELALKEEKPEKILRRAGELGVLAKLHPSLKGDGWLAEKFRQARDFTKPDLPQWGLYLALVIYRLRSEEAEQLISYLRLPKLLAKTIRDTVSLKNRLPWLEKTVLAPSRIYHTFDECSQTAIEANLLASDSLMVRERTRLYLNELRHVKPALTGEDLLRMGIPAGPRIKEILQLLLEARLDGKVTGKDGEEELVKQATQSS